MYLHFSVSLLRHSSQSPSRHKLLKFLCIFHVKESKGYFPKLEYDRLPPPETFYSSLRECNVLESDYLQYQNLMSEKGLSSQAAMAMFRIDSPPLNLQETYQMLQEEWRAKGFRKFEDYLREYNKIQVLWLQV